MYGSERHSSVLSTAALIDSKMSHKFRFLPDVFTISQLPLSLIVLMKTETNISGLSSE